MRAKSILIAVLLCGAIAAAPASAQTRERTQPLRTGPVEMAIPQTWVITSLAMNADQVSDPANRAWSLEIGADAIDAAPNRPQPDQLARMAESAVAREIAAHEGNVVVETKPDEQVVVHNYTAGGANPLRVRAWHRIAIRGNSYVLASFTFRVSLAAAERPENAAALAQVEKLALGAALKAP